MSRNCTAVLRRNYNRLVSPVTKCCFDTGAGSLNLNRFHRATHLLYFHDKSLDPTEKVLPKLQENKKKYYLQASGSRNSYFVQNCF